MDNHFMKFAFLAAVVGAVLFSRMAYPTALPAALSEVRGSQAAAQGAQSKKVPVFILPSVAAPAGGDVEDATTTLPSFPPAASVPRVSIPPPKLASAASLVADVKSGAVFEAANAEKRWPTASLAKLMTAVVAADKLDPAAKITVTEAMFAADPTEQTLVVGGTYAVSDLLRMMLLPSSNVAAEALAAFYGRGRFIDEMNARAAAWGMANTYFSDPAGISAASQSTASDILKLTGKIYANYPQIFPITRMVRASITEQNSGKKISIKNINNFAGNADFVGGKTGYTSEAGGNLLSVFKHGPRLIFIVVLGTDDRFGNTRTLYDWFKKYDR